MRGTPARVPTAQEITRADADRARGAQDTASRTRRPLHSARLSRGCDPRAPRSRAGCPGSNPRGNTERDDDPEPAVARRPHHICDNNAHDSTQDTAAERHALDYAADELHRYVHDDCNHDAHQRAAAASGVNADVKGPCEDHWAELSNSKRVFHRLYVIGTTTTTAERDKWLVVIKDVQDGFKASEPAEGWSTEKVLEEPTTAEFAQELQRLKDTVQPCEEVTLYLTAHGGGGVDYGGGAKVHGDARAEYAVLKQRRNPKTKELEVNELIDESLSAKWSRASSRTSASH